MTEIIRVAERCARKQIKLKIRFSDSAMFWVWKAVLLYGLVKLRWLFQISSLKTNLNEVENWTWQKRAGMWVLDRMVNQVTRMNSKGWRKKVSIRTSKDENSGESVKLVLFLDDLSEVWMNKLWKGPTFGSWSKYTSKKVSGVGCFVISVPETTWTWIFQKCAKIVGRGAVCLAYWAWGSVFGLFGVGRFCTCDWCKRGVGAWGRLLPEF